MWNFPSFLCNHTAGRACTFLNELQKCVFVSAHECEHVCVTAQRPLLFRQSRRDSGQEICWSFGGSQTNVIDRRRLANSSTMPVTVGHPARFHPRPQEVKQPGATYNLTAPKKLNETLHV